MKRFFILFTESTFEGSQAAALKMRKIAEHHTKHDQTYMMFHSLHFLLVSDTKKLSWPNSPHLVLPQVVDPNMSDALQKGEVTATPLHDLSEQSDTSDYSVHENLLILAKQLIAHGANVNAVATVRGDTPLHKACHWANVTNLDFLELLLEEGADPNAQDHDGLTPLLNTTPCSPGAVNFLLNWPTTDADIATRSGASFLAGVREIIALPDNPGRIQEEFLLQQWREFEEMLVEREAADTGITVFDVRASSTH
jgi:hypothetical protein